MKGSLLFLGASSALALRESISSRSDEICISSQLLAASSSNPICRNKDGIQLATSRDSQSPLTSSGSSLTWTKTTSCSKNGTSALQFCIYHSADYAGKGISIITDKERADHISRSWGFTKPESLEGVNQPLPKFRVAEVPGKGYGLVATHRIARGEVIIKETASLLIDYGAFLMIPPDQMKKMQAEAIDYLPFSHRSQWMNMSSHGYRGDHLSMVDKILVTNSFDVEMDDAKRDDDFYAVFVNSKHIFSHKSKECGNPNTAERPA